ncbi:MAG: hypothetical protein WD711_01525 [Dongiaceae bacterium]
MTLSPMTDHRILWRRAPKSSCPAAPAPGRFAALILSLVLSVGLLAGCTYSGDIDDPLVRRTQWFSYVQGEDIVATCTAGAPDRLRLVYNADFLEQVRSYELTADGAGGAIVVVRAAAGGASLSNVRLNDLQSAWGWHKAEARLDPAGYQALLRALEADGFFERRDNALRLNSRDYYWLATGCIDGVAEAGAWLNGRDNLSSLAFGQMLWALDEAELPIARPRWVDPADRRDRPGEAGDDVTIKPFWITVRDRPTQP